MTDSDSGCVSASADDNARAPTPEQLSEAKDRASDDRPVTSDGPLIPAQVLALTRRIKALIEKGDRAAEKAEQFYKSAGIHIKEIKQRHSGHWETFVREECNISRSRAYELMAIADGRTTLEKVRASTNERQKVHRAKSESVTSRTEPDEILDAIAGGECRDSCVMRVMGGELAAERVTGSAKVDVEQHRKRMAALGDDAMPTEEEADESWQADLYDAACLLLEQMSDATRRRFFDKTTEMANEADDDARGTIAPPAQIEDNLFHHLDRMNHFAKVFKKHFKLSTFDREAKGRINTAIERTIQKWRSTQAALRGRINDIEREVLRDADDGAAS